MKTNYFKVLSGVKCDVDKKGPQKLNYISWSEAWSEVKLKYPSSTYERIRNDDKSYLFKSGTGGMCEVAVTIEDITHSIDLPVLDFRNQPVAYEQIDSFQINKTLMRAFTKAIAMHGIGLYVYRGEDLPDKETDKPRIEKPKPKPKPKFTEANFEVLKDKTDYKDYTEAKEKIEKKYKLDLVIAKVVKHYYENKDKGVEMGEDGQPPF